MEHLYHCPPQGTENVSTQTKGQKDRKSQQIERRCEMLSAGHDMAMAFQLVAIEVICARSSQVPARDGEGLSRPLL